MKISARNILKGKIIDVVKGATTSHVYRRRRGHRVYHQRSGRRASIEKGNGGRGRHQIL